jgi:SAM-dependent methyltransferase
MEKLYADLATWWPRLSPVEDYDEEAFAYLALLQNAFGGPLAGMLELGSGGGHLAHHVPAEIPLTLVDVSPQMLALSSSLNPHREHIQADMRSMRLQRTFDAVLLHDAVTYMTNEDDLAAALGTVRAHLNPGGVALIAPDFTLETLVPNSSSVGGGDDARLLEWRHDPVGTTLRIDFAMMMRQDDGTVSCVHDTHVQGIFPFETWFRLLADAGLELIPLEEHNASNILFLVRAL